LETRLSENFGLHGTGWLTLGTHYNSWMYKIRRKVLLPKIKSLCIDFSNIDVLDVGCGTGFYIDMWKELGIKRLSGIDIADVVIENLKKKYNTEDFYRLDIGDDDISRLQHRYDIISAFDVLYHIVDDKRYLKAIKNIHSLLRPNGIFIFSENFVHSDAIRGVHQVSRPLGIIEKILIRNGFEILERFPVFILMNTPLDTTDPITKLIWGFITSTVRHSEKAGMVIGGILYPLELLLLLLLKEGPSTEIMICKKTREDSGR
jgi:SAM-dependent methyltransferase